MKKQIASILCVILLFTAAAAQASENLYGAALITEDRIYYSGSVDGVTRGVFSMDEQGGDVRTLYGSDALLLARWNDLLFVEDYEKNQLVALKADGTEALRLDGYFDTAVESDDALFLNHVKLTRDGDKFETQAWFPLEPGDEWLIKPVECEDGFLYYYDYRQCEEGAEMGGGAALMRMNIKTGALETQSAASTDLIAMEDGFAYYTRTPLSEDAAAETPSAEAGLFKRDLSNGTETRLSELRVPSDFYYIDYAMEADGVIYGLLSDLSGDETDSGSKLLRVGTDGVALPELDMPAGTLCAAEDGKLLLCSFDADYLETGKEQNDRLLLFDTKTLQKTELNPDGALVLFFSEADPQLLIENGRIYGFTFDEEALAMSLFSVNTDGSDLRILAKG